MFQIMAVGKPKINKIYYSLLSFYLLETNIQFHWSQMKDNVLIVTELDNIRLSLSLDELPQMIPYLDRLYDNAMDAIHRCTYEANTAVVPSEFGNCQQPKVIKAITEKSIDRNRINDFYHPYH